jgi:hypothetical protein
MTDTLKKISETRSERLPVVDNLTSQRPIGSISKTDIVLHLAGEQSRADEQWVVGGELEKSPS